MQKLMQKFIGAHVSTEGGVENAPLNAMKIGAKAFAFFTKNQRQWNAPPLKKETIDAFKKNLKQSQITKEFILPHDSYLINLGNPDIEKRQRATTAFIEEILRVHQLGLLYLNFHPGSSLKLISDDECIKFISTSLNKAMLATPENTILVIENSAGQGGTIGYTLEHIAKIIEGIDSKYQNRIGVCIDSCHALVSGYDLNSEEGYEYFWKSFDRLIGKKFLKAMHVNDSQMPLDSKRDRHASIGEGYLKLDFFKKLLSDPRTNNIPLILETPNDELWPDEIKKLYSYCM